MKLTDAAWKESYNKPRQHIKKQRHHFDNNGPSSWGYGFSSGHVRMWELDYKESWAPKNWCIWIMVLEKTPLDYKEIQPVHPRGDQSWVFVGRTDVEAETPILWPPHVKSWLIWKDPDAGKDWGQEEKETTEGQMVGWHHLLNGHEFGWTPGVGDGQGGLACCSSWGCKESDMTEWLNWTELIYKFMDFIQLFKEQVFGLTLIFSSVWTFSYFTCFSSFAFYFLPSTLHFFLASWGKIWHY